LEILDAWTQAARFRVKFSVVIPTCHRPDGLAACLERLAPGKQDGMKFVAADADYEVIVSDAGTRETSAAMLRARFPWARWVSAAGCGPGPNRNVGARLAQGDWIAFVDDDCLPEHDWLAKLNEKSSLGGVDVVEGAIHSHDLPDHPLWTAPLNTSGNAGWTANLCVRRTVFEKLGGFDPDLPETAEDMEFHVRSKRAGAKWVFAREAVVVHPPRRMTWRQFWRETLRFRWWFMFRLKTGAGAGIEVGSLRALWDVCSALTLLYARMTWHFGRDAMRGGGRKFARREAFLRARDWILLPVLAPYFWRWSMQYRAQLRGRKMA
jgi:GT2 family glycosyltransferase